MAGRLRLASVVRTLGRADVFQNCRLGAQRIAIDRLRHPASLNPHQAGQESEALPFIGWRIVFFSTLSLFDIGLFDTAPW